MEDKPMFEFPCDFSDVEADFVDYCYHYYGIECGDWRKFATRNEIVLATKIRLLNRPKIEFDGDTMDREIVRDVIQQAQYFTWKLSPFVPIGYVESQFSKEMEKRMRKLKKSLKNIMEIKKNLVNGKMV